MNTTPTHWTKEILQELKHQGIPALSDIELMMLLIGDEPSVKALYAACKGSLKALSNMSWNELAAIEGIGASKAGRILAAFELARRRGKEQQYRTKITCSEHAARYISPHIANSEQEIFMVLYLNRSNEIIAHRLHFTGTISNVTIDVRIIFREAVQQLASALILSHNHPSGNLSPSQADIDITHKLVAAAVMFDITVLDHVIVTSNGYYSLADNHLL